MVSVKNFYKDKTILITGGAGYIGRLLIEKLLDLEPKVIRVFDIHENGLFDLRQKYRDNEGRLRFLLGDVRNLTRLQYAFNDVDIVFHTASYKHVVECEYNPLDAIETNIIGTSNVIQAAIDKKVKKVIYTSSDKAANPSNTMGTTKLLAEKLMIAGNDYGAHTTVFACCRFGNVAGSTGSVIPLFKKQISENKKITITDPEMTRFLISKDKAIELVLLSGVTARGGEIFIFKMPSININELADAMIERYGHASKEIIGRRAGEKMYEEIMNEEEMYRAHEGKDIYIVSPQIADSSLESLNGLKKVKNIKNSRDVGLSSKDEILKMLSDLE